MEGSKRSHDNAVTPRKMSIFANPNMERYWYDKNPLITTFFYALSAIFPEGERFFIHSVRHYQGGVRDKFLADRVRGFIGQEAHHGKIHEDFNIAIARLGIPIDVVSERQKSAMNFVRKHAPAQRQLAMTVALEHLTASLAEYVLVHPSLLQKMDPEFRKLFIWHAIEEIEHKSVAFDVYIDQVGNENLRRRVAFFTYLIFFIRIAWCQIMLLWGARCIPRFSHIRSAFSFFWGRGGVWRSVLRMMRPYFSRGFHPDSIDQFHLIEDWQQRYPDVSKLEQA